MTRDCELMIFVAVVLLGAQRVRISDNLAQRRRGAQVSHWSAHEKLLLHGKCQLLMRVMTHRVITANGLSVCIYLAISCFMKNLLIHFLFILDNRHYGDLSGVSRALGAASTYPGSPGSGRASGNVTSPTRTP